MGRHGVNGLCLRRATLADADLLLQWRNDPSVRATAFQTSPISLATHQLWFQARLDSPNSRIWLLENNGTPVGQVRYDCVGGKAEIAIAVSPSERGRGFGRMLLMLSIERACNELKPESLVAVVKTTNDPSIRTFRSAGSATAF